METASEARRLHAEAWTLNVKIDGSLVSVAHSS
jgi:hypothetical protein